MQSNKYIIKKDFLEAQKYKDILLHTYKYQELFKSWLAQIYENYRGFNQPRILHNSHTINTDGFNNLIFPFINKIYDVSTQHLQYVSSIMRQSGSFSLERETQRLLEKVIKLNQSQLKFEGTYRDLLSAQNRISLQPSHNAQFYYYSNWFKRLNALQKYSKSIKIIRESKPDKQKIYSLSEQLETQLLQFRKKIIDYKYGYLKQGVKLSRQLLKCLSEYLTIGIQILSKINGKLKMQGTFLQRKSSSLRDSYSSNGLMNDHLSEFHENYESKTQAFKNTLTNIQSIFALNKPKIDKKLLFEEMLQMYSGNEHLLEQMFDTFNIFELLSNKRKTMYQKITHILAIIESEHKLKKKQVQVLQTLTKTKSLDSLRHSASLNYQFDTRTIERSVSEVIQFSLKTFSQLSQMCYHISTKATESRPTQNNMSISYQYKEVKIKNKRPSKQEIWMWKDWREFRVFQDVVPKFDDKTIMKNLDHIRKIMQDDNSGQEKISCMIEGRVSGKASMQISPEKIQITSKKDSAVNFILPFEYIEYVQPKKKKLILKMDGGSELKLSEFKNLVDVQKKINQFYLQKENDNKGVMKKQQNLRPVIKITDEQIEAIKNREREIQTVKTSLQGFTKYGQNKVKDVSIQQVYQNIFSDKKSCPISKNQGFSEYFNVRGGNYNFSYKPYDNPGPYFYTGLDKTITFVNASLTTTRQLEFDHPLPPVPFIPKSIHCKTRQTIAWISDKQFQILAITHSFGNKMMESFHTCTLYKVIEETEGVRMQIYCKIQFKQGATMKSLLQNGAIGQIKKLIPELLKQMERCLKMAIRARSTQTNEQVSKQEKDEESQEKVSSETSIGKSEQSQPINRTIIYLVIGTVLINILLNILF